MTRMMCPGSGVKTDQPSKGENYGPRPSHHTCARGGDSESNHPPPNSAKETITPSKCQPSGSASMKRGEVSMRDGVTNASWWTPRHKHGPKECNPECRGAKTAPTIGLKERQREQRDDGQNEPGDQQKRSPPRAMRTRPRCPWLAGPTHLRRESRTQPHGSATADAHVPTAGGAPLAPAPKMASGGAQQHWNASAMYERDWRKRDPREGVVKASEQSD
jgi:hypothetical protein